MNKFLATVVGFIAAGTSFTLSTGIAAGEDAPKVAPAEVVASVVKAANPDSCARHIVLIGSLMQKNGTVRSICAQDNEDVSYAGFADGETVTVKFTNHPAVRSSNLYMWDDADTNLHQSRVVDFDGTVKWSNGKRCQPDGGTVSADQMPLKITYGDLFMNGQLAFIDGEKVAAVIGCGWEAPTPPTTTAPTTTTTAGVTTTTAAITTTTEAPPTTQPERVTFPTNVTVKAGQHAVQAEDSSSNLYFALVAGFGLAVFAALVQRRRQLALAGEQV